MSRKSVILQKKEESTKSIRDLGVLPEEAFEKYQEVNSNKVSHLTIAQVVLCNFEFSC
jgi:structural maintenance of chromosome 3 (chondroitin sulfate proteoglycan 6)